MNNDEQVNKNTLSIELLKKDIGYIKKGVDDIKAGVSNVRKEVSSMYATKEDIDGLDKRVGRFESWAEWGMRIIIGAILAGILALLGLVR